MKINIIGSIEGYRKIFAEDYKLMKKEREDKNYTKVPPMVVDSAFNIENYMLIVGGQELWDNMNAVKPEKNEDLKDAMLAYIDGTYRKNVLILFDVVSKLMQTKEDAKIEAEFRGHSTKKLTSTLDGVDVNELRGLFCSYKGGDFYISFLSAVYMIKIFCDGKAYSTGCFRDKSIHSLDYNLNKVEIETLLVNNENIEMELKDFMQETTAM